MEELLFLITAQALVSHGGPVTRIGQVQVRPHDHGKNVGNIAFWAGGDPTVRNIEVEPAIVVIIEELRAPTPSGVRGARFPRDIRKSQISVVVPKKIALSHIVISDVRHINVQISVTVVVSPVDIHSLLGVISYGRCGKIRESAIAAVV